MIGHREHSWCHKIDISRFKSKVFICNIYERCYWFPPSFSNSFHSFSKLCPLDIRVRVCPLYSLPRGGLSIAALHKNWKCLKMSKLYSWYFKHYSTNQPTKTNQPISEFSSFLRVISTLWLWCNGHHGTVLLLAHTVVPAEGAIPI